MYFTAAKYIFNPNVFSYDAKYVNKYEFVLNDKVSFAFLCKHFYIMMANVYSY